MPGGGVVNSDALVDAQAADASKAANKPAAAPPAAAVPSKKTSSAPPAAALSRPKFNGKPIKLDNVQVFEHDGSADTAKRDHVRQMIKHAWDGYRQHAWGYDELNPLSKTGHNWTVGSSLLFTPVDSMDTLWLAGLRAEFADAKRLVLSSLSFDVDAEVNVFETTIRVLGGLLGAYEVDGDEKILEKAVQLADKLMAVFDTPTGIPKNLLNLASGRATAGAVSLATAGTLQLEFQYLSDVTGIAKYANAALYAMEQLYKTPQVIHGLYHLHIEIQTTLKSALGQEYGIGAEGDSFYEYLLKLAISTKDERYRQLYDDSADASDHWLAMGNDGEHAYLPNLKYGRHDSSFHHLTCFAGGMFALGAVSQPDGNSTRMFKTGEIVTKTCYDSYQAAPSRLGGEWVGANSDGKLRIDSASYLLRPEVVESIFYMWRFTKDVKYRDWGWNIVQALDKQCKHAAGYAGINDQSRPHDRQESFFLAETLKYLYLLFAEDEALVLDKYVLNTEAHVLSIRSHGKRSLASKWITIPPAGAFPRQTRPS
ncbi:glycoside hydrolase [Entophlyctis helioformis]|nr:glycoside hydrolase [Entophlyctis helioformis]